LRRLLAAAALLALVLPAAALADHSVTELVAVPSNGVAPATVLPSGGFSADGNHAVLATNERLDPADTDSQSDVYLRSFLTDTTRLISIGPSGGNGPYEARVEVMAQDGSRVIFSTLEPLVAADTDSSRDLYERLGGTTTLLSVGPSGGNGPFDATLQAATPDAAHVFLRTSEQLTAADTFNGPDVYERSAGVTTLVTTGPAGGGCAESFASTLRTTDDGSHVLIATERQLTTDDTDSQYDVYLRAAGATTRVSTGPTGGNGAFPAHLSALSADGTRAVYWTSEQLVPEDTDSTRDVYMYDNGTTVLISTGPGFGPQPRDANFAGAARDGSRVFLHTSEALTPDDTDTQNDVYQRRGATTTLISRNTPDVSTNTASFAPGIEGVSDDGRRVLFTSVSPVTPEDTDPAQGCWENADGDFFPKDCKDVFLYDESTDSISLVSTGPGAGGAYDVEFETQLSADGTRAFFITREPILGQDAFSLSCMNDFSQVGCIDVYERTLGPTPSTTLVTKGPTGGFGANEVFGPDIEIGVGASRDGRRYYFYSDEQLTSADTDGAAYDLYVSAVAEPGGYPRPKGATKIFASLVPAFTACGAPNRTHGPPLAFGSCNPPGPASSGLTVGGSGGGSPALSSGYVQFHAPFDPPGPPDGADVNVTVHLTNVMRLSDLSDYTGELRATATIRMTDRDSGAPSTIGDFPVGMTVPCAATADPTLGAACDVQTTFDSVVPGLAPEGMRSVHELGQVRVLDGGPDEDADTAADNSLFAVQGVFVP
jgi:hypothetical protein